MAQPKKPRQKQIKLSHIAKQYSDVNKMSTHILNEEENITIKYFDKFDEKRIQNVMKEANSSLLQDKEQNLNFFKNDDEVFIQYVLFLVIKHFTNLEKEIPDSLAEQINIFNQIISIGLFEEMFNEVFPPDQVSIVLERIGNFAQLSQQIAETETETRLKAIETVQHPVVKKKLQEGKFDAKV